MDGGPFRAHTHHTYKTQQVHVEPEGGGSLGYILPQNRTYNVWVGDLHQEATDQELIDAFQPHGNVVKVCVDLCVCVRVYCYTLSISYPSNR